MTDNKIIDPLAADIFTAMFNATANTTERVIENYQREIALLKEDYATLWRAIETANKQVDSQRIENILALTQSKYERAAEGQGN